MQMILKVLVEHIFQELDKLNLMNFKNQRLKKTLKMILKRALIGIKKLPKSSKGGVYLNV